MSLEKTIKTRDFYFDLPERLIAQNPSPERGKSRMLLYDRNNGYMTHSSVENLAEYLSKDHLLVFNNTKVRKARVYGTTIYGGKREFLFLSPLDFQYRPLAQETASCYWQVMAGSAKKQIKGTHYVLPGEINAEVIAHQGSLRILEAEKKLDENYFARYGHVPLPPYIKRQDGFQDERRYQTVYAESSGSVASPTAGLHFTDALLKTLDNRGIQCRSITLHVGLGTFLPVRHEDIRDHSMHSEEYHIAEDVAMHITQHRREGKPVLAVGTTSVRTLESAWDFQRNILVPGRKATNIFIYPGYVFKAVDAIFTNFHTPESTLLMLVAAFAGREELLKAYRHAVDCEYRFFSYGDAMLIQ